VPHWIKLIPASRFEGRDRRGPFLLNDPNGVIAETRTLDMEQGLHVDLNHQTDIAAAIKQG
jgi:hypothetical protein